MVRVASHVAMGLAVLALAVAPAWGQASQEDVKKELDTLKAKVAALEAQKSGEPTPITFAPDEDGAKALGLLEQIAKDVKIYGFVDSGYVLNADDPSDGVNRFRAFDPVANSFYLHNAQLTFEKLATKDALAGFKIELAMGTDAEGMDAASENLSDPALAGPLSDGDLFDVQEAYVQILAPWGNGVDIKVGKFATLAGFEVIESKDDWNYSRSLLFTWAIPFTHTGVRASYTANDYVSLSAGLNNGWDNILDTNNGVTLEFGAGITPHKAFPITLAIYYGDEDTVVGPAPDGKRMVVDITAKLIGDEVGLQGFTFGLNFDMGSQEDGTTDPTSGLPDDAEWSGFAIYGKYQINDKIAGILRFESFDDEHDFRTGAIANASPSAIISAGTTGAVLQSITATLEVKPASDLILRLEVRQDTADEDVFIGSGFTGGIPDAEDANMTVGLEAIFTF